jgi:peptide/nickel transport system permease protein
MRFFVRRAVFYLFTAWAAITLNFFLPRMLKGDPVTAYINKNQGLISPDQIDALRVLFGLDTDLNLWQQYIEYWKLLFQGDLGRSFSNGLAPVTDVIGGALPWTVGLVGLSTIISFVLGTLIGAVIGWRRSRGSDLVVPISTFLSTVPYFWMGLLAIAVLSSVLGWFPASHAFDKTSTPGWNGEFILDVLYHGTLPALTIVISSLGGWILGMRNMMVTVLDEACRAGVWWRPTPPATRCCRSCRASPSRSASSSAERSSWSSSSRTPASESCCSTPRTRRTTRSCRASSSSSR